MKSLFKKIPFFRKIYNQYSETKYRQKFSNDCYGCFLGVFETFEDAMKSAPLTKSIGYDNADLAEDYKKMLENNSWELSNSKIRSYDYPVIYWIGNIIQQSQITNHKLRVFDFGGNVGIHYLTYSTYLKYPDNLSWTVCELPEIVKVGKSINNEPKLSFTTNFEDASSTDIFLASGSIQYVDNIQLKINEIREKPKHILINRLGLYNGDKIVTLQNGGRVFYPQYIFNKSEFINEFAAIGYELIDIWEDNIDRCYIPFHPEVQVPCYYGLYLKLG
jgi:putative methyltransferase (TIGR04325 family)